MRNIVITIEGKNFSSSTGFYDEIELKFTKGVNWKIGRNLNALNDVLRGGFGIHEYEEPITIVWENSKKSENDLAFNETIAYLEKKLNFCHPSNVKAVESDRHWQDNKRAYSI